MIIGVLAGFVVLGAACAGAETRTLTDTQGRTIEGTILSFDSENQTIEFQRLDGKKGSLKLSLLSEKDQVFIREWAVETAFMTELKIVPRLVTTPVATEDTRDKDVTKQVAEFNYDVTLSNASSAALGKVEAEYCIFYRQGIRSGSTINYDEGVCYGKATWDSVKASGAVSLQSKKIKLYSAVGASTLFGQAGFSDANVRGIWLRLTTKLPSGEKLTREMRTADDTGYVWKWKPGSIGVGLNGSDSPYRMIITH